MHSIRKKDKQEIADRLRNVSEDEMKMHNLAVELWERGYSPAAETIDRFRFGTLPMFSIHTAQGSYLKNAKNALLT